MQNICAFTIIILLILGAFIMFGRNESFYVSPNIVGGGDFHINTPGTFADQGSFVNDMQDYLYNE